jgi:hypothetical protein
MANPIRGQSSEPIELRPGGGTREAARIAELERWAWRRVRALRVFYSHLSVYVVVNFILFMLAATTPFHSSWSYAVLIGWGLVIVLHCLHAYELLPWTTHDWEQRKVRELIDHRLRR